jgi:hypothetical protein
MKCFFMHNGVYNTEYDVTSVATYSRFEEWSQINCNPHYNDVSLNHLYS